MRLGAVTLAAVMVVAVLMAWPGRALACSCVALTTEERFARADIVFVGRVAAVVPAEGRPGATLATLVAETVWKGPVQAQYAVRGGAGGGDCTVAFAEGETYLVFARGTPDAALETSTCDGTAPLAASADLAALGPGTAVAPTGAQPGSDGTTAETVEAHLIMAPADATAEPTGAAGDRDAQEAGLMPTEVVDAQLIMAPAEPPADRAGMGVETLALGALGLAAVGGGAGWLVWRRRAA
ncbi:MAG: hypothetical protein QJR03_00230 [Sphaerobacter sp.]|nr:hypothetical protein [Sphaerobacter sp.]